MLSEDVASGLAIQPAEQPAFCRVGQPIKFGAIKLVERTFVEAGFVHAIPLIEQAANFKQRSCRMSRRLRWRFFVLGNPQRGIDMPFQSPRPAPF